MTDESALIRAAEAGEAAAGHQGETPGGDKQQLTEAPDDKEEDMEEEATQDPNDSRQYTIYDTIVPCMKVSHP